MRPGHPVIAGGWPFVSDLRTGAFTGGSGEQALLSAATSADPKFFLGTDSAPHTSASKELACGCAGVEVDDVGAALDQTPLGRHHVGRDLAW